MLQPGQAFDVVMPVFPGLTALDLIGPYEVFARVRGVRVHFAWKTLEPVTASVTTPPGVTLVPTHRYADVERADLVCVPGGPGHIAQMEDADTLAFLRRVSGSARWITSVCTGSLILGAAGLLRGYRATTHWGSMDALAAFGAEAVAERVVVDRDRITGGGVTSGIDFALEVLRRLWGERTAQLAQLGLEYDPAPPVNAGSPRSAPPELLAQMRTLMEPYRARQADAVARAAARLPPR